MKPKTNSPRVEPTCAAVPAAGGNEAPRSAYLERHRGKAYEQIVAEYYEAKRGSPLPPYLRNNPSTPPRRLSVPKDDGSWAVPPGGFKVNTPSRRWRKVRHGCTAPNTIFHDLVKKDVLEKVECPPRPVAKQTGDNAAVPLESS